VKTKLVKMEENLKSIPFEHLFEITHRVCTEPDLIEVNMDAQNSSTDWIWTEDDSIARLLF